MASIAEITPRKLFMEDLATAASFAQTTATILGLGPGIPVSPFVAAASDVAAAAAGVPLGAVYMRTGGTFPYLRSSATQASIAGTGVVTMTHDADGNWIVFKQDGSALDTTGTTTDGLQEAIIYATTNLYNLIVHGGGGNNAAIINCATTVAVPAVLNWHFQALGVTFNWAPGIGSNPCMTFDSALVFGVDFRGSQIVNFGTGPCVRLKPTNVVPFDGSIAISAGTFYLGNIANVHSPQSDTVAAALIEFDLTNGAILDMTIQVDELNGAGCAILVKNPTGGTPYSFRGNTIVCNNVHDQSGTTYACVQVGTTTTNAVTYLNGNTFNLWSVQLNVASKVGYQVWGAGNIFNTNVFQIAPGASYAVFFGSSAEDNQIFAGQLQGAAGPSSVISIGGTANRNRLYLQTSKNNLPITVGASPFTYRNQDFVHELVTIKAVGSITDIQISADDITYASIGAQQGLGQPLDPGLYVKVLYTGAAPEMRRIF